MRSGLLSERVDGALDGDRRSLAQLVTLFEDPRDGGLAARAEVMQLLDDRGVRDAGVVTGVTGPPGVGKSTLISTLATSYVRAHSNVRISVVSIDPSSTISGGSLLGDRTRLTASSTERIFWRSQPSGGTLGGVARSTGDVTRLLRRLFDHVLVETVGVGQSEVDIVHLAAWSWLVLQPMTGDAIQFLKAGIMEVPQVVVLNKSDTGDARRTLAALRSALRLTARAEPTPIVTASSHNADGIETLITMLEQRRSEHRPDDSRRADLHHLMHWVRLNWGTRGLAALGGEDGLRARLRAAPSLDAAQQSVVHWASAHTPGSG